MPVSGPFWRPSLLLLLTAAAFTAPLADAPRAAEERVAPENATASGEHAEEATFHQDGRRRSVQGRVVMEAADGGLLFEAEDGVLHSIEPHELLRREPLDSPFEPQTPDELAERLLAELPAGFRVHTTPHYVVCYNTSRAYAQWTSSLLERLYKAFTNFWENEGLELCEPEFPLPIVIFADPHTYDEASRQDLPNGTGVLRGAGGIVGY